MTTTVPDGSVLDFEAGHGTFIAGIIRQVCPDAQVEVVGSAVELRGRGGTP